MRIALWVQIFVYTIVLLVVSQALSFFLHNALFFDDLRLHFKSSVKPVLAELSGRPLEIVQTHARLYSHGAQRIWLTTADGSALPGQEFFRHTVLNVVVYFRESDRFNLIEGGDAVSSPHPNLPSTSNG